MEKTKKVIIIIANGIFALLTVWAIVGGEGNIARRILSLVGAVIFSVVGLTVSAVFSYFYEKGGGLPR